jgi:hypothetical protein
MTPLLLMALAVLLTYAARSYCPGTPGSPIRPSRSPESVSWLAIREIRRCRPW